VEGGRGVGGGRDEMREGQRGRGGRSAISEELGEGVSG